jgi:hypothetical protein
MDEDPNGVSPLDVLLMAVVTLGGAGLGGACGFVLACLYLQAQPSGGSFARITGAFFCLAFAVLLGGALGAWLGFSIGSSGRQKSG